MTDCGKLKSIKKRGEAIKYTSAFRYACVEKLLENPEKPITVIVRSIGINAWTLWSWYDKYKKEQLSIQAGQEPVNNFVQLALF